MILGMETKDHELWLNSTVYSSQFEKLPFKANEQIFIWGVWTPWTPPPLPGYGPVLLYKLLFSRGFYFREFREPDPRENFHFNSCLFIVMTTSEKSRN